MPRADPTDPFVWRSSLGPRRIRLAGAIAIAVSCGGLGVLAGRWSLQVGTAEPKGRTAALIAAVSEETRAKPTGPSSPAQGGAVAPPSLVAQSAAQPSREAEPTPVPALKRPPLEPPHPARAHPEDARASEVGDAGTAGSPTPMGDTATAAMGGRRPNAPLSRATPAPPSRAAMPTAPNYQALRDYALSR